MILIIVYMVRNFAKLCRTRNTLMPGWNQGEALWLVFADVAYFRIGEGVGCVPRRFQVLSELLAKWDNVAISYHPQPSFRHVVSRNPGVFWIPDKNTRGWRSFCKRLEYVNHLRQLGDWEGWAIGVGVKVYKEIFERAENFKKYQGRGGNSFAEIWSHYPLPAAVIVWRLTGVWFML